MTHPSGGIIPEPSSLSNTLRHALRLAEQGVPEELATRDQWVTWEYGATRANGGREKAPVDPHTGRRARTNDPATWGTLREALGRARRGPGDGGVGFVWSRDDPYTGIDFDGCRDPETGEIEDWVLNAVARLDSYTEVSVSGTGLHVIVRGRLPGGGRKAGPVEMYDQGRFFCFTGQPLGYGSQKPIAERQGLVEVLYEKLARKKEKAADAEPETNHRRPSTAPLEDGELIEKIRHSGNGPKFSGLYDQGDTHAYRSASEADMALMGVLAFWTGCDPERMERMFSASALGQRDKWRRRADYRGSTVETAISNCNGVYGDKRTERKATPSEAVETLVSERQAWALADTWEGKTGPGERWLYGAHLDLARTHGKASQDGVVYAAASRDLALGCGKTREKVETLTAKLLERGLLERLEKGRGQKASTYLIPHTNHHHTKWSHSREPSTTVTSGAIEVNTVGLYKEKHPVYTYGTTLWKWVGRLLARVGNPAPQINEDYDKNGRWLPKESKHLLRTMGDARALLVEKVAACPGMDTDGLARSVGRGAKWVEGKLEYLLDGGYVVEEAGLYRVPEDLPELIGELLHGAGRLEKEEKRRKSYEREREEYRKEYEGWLEEKEEKRREEELTRVARECGVEEEDSTLEAPESYVEAPPAPDPQEAAPEVIQSVTEVREIAVEVLGKARRRDPLVHTNTSKTRFFRGIRADVDTDLRTAVHDYLELNPRGWEETPSWIGTTLWAYDLYPRRPDPQEVADAMKDLRERRAA